MKKNLQLGAVVLLILLAGCSGPGRRDGVPSGRLDPDTIPDAQPRHEPITRAGNKNPYTVLGKTYRLLPTSKGYRARGTASWYGSKFHGASTANGETYDAMAMTAAHTTLPIPCYVQVTNLENGRRVIVRVNDRGPFVDNRIIDLSYAAATKLGYVNKGIALVEVTAIDVDNWPPSRAAADMPAPLFAPAPSSNTGIEARSAVPAASDERHYVQAGAFSSERAASELRRQLARSTGQPVEVMPSTAPPLYRVRVGPFASRDLAEQVRRDLAAGAARDARVISE
ncbi:MAG: septal ring lytic transglycosylase RlpA family protein [Spongiibacteraceae bacterium]